MALLRHHQAQSRSGRLLQQAKAAAAKARAERKAAAAEKAKAVAAKPAAAAAKKSLAGAKASGGVDSSSPKSNRVCHVPPLVSARTEGTPMCSGPEKDMIKVCNVKYFGRGISGRFLVSSALAALGSCIHTAASGSEPSSCCWLRWGKGPWATFTSIMGAISRR